jgi:tRNA splicing ligase
MAGGEWIEAAIKAAFALSGGIGGLFIGVWKWGRSSAKAEQAVKNQITALREEVRKEMAAHVRKIEDGHDDLVNHFEESFNGIRRQFDEHKYYTEKDFMKKEDFKDFREEYREDMRDLKASIAGIARTS